MMKQQIDELFVRRNITKDINKTSDELLASITGGTDEDNNHNTLTELEKVLVRGIAKIMKKNGNDLDTVIAYFR